MKNSELTCDQLDRAYALEFFTTYRGKRCVSSYGEVRTTAMLELVFTCVVSELPTLDGTKKYKARQLCNEGIWLRLSHAEISCAGLCLAYLVDGGALPLRRHDTPSGKGPRTYWIN
jgi:hypothetical protein